MRRTHLFFTTVALAAFGFSMLGCTSSQPAATPAVPRSDTQADDAGHDHASHEHDGDVEVTDMDKMKAALAKLPEADRLAAEKQHMCPVSGEMLGTMGAPLKVAVKGQDVWLCCEGCKDQLLESPDEFLAKLPQ